MYLTNNQERSDKEAVSTAHADEAGAPDEYEEYYDREAEAIPAAVVEAGVFAFEQFMGNGLTPDIVVREVFLAMARKYGDESVHVLCL